jgi:Flp pilus assembly protein CpaB
MTVAAGAAVLGGAILIMFLSAYRNSLTGSDGTKKVLVATVLIEPGSPADALASDNMYEVTSIEKADIESGAVEDPSTLKDQITKATVYPGEQLTTSDFREQTDSLGDQIRGRERAISLPFTQYGGLVGDLKAGDHVDVIGAFMLDPSAGGSVRPVSRLLIQDALVLKAPDELEGGATGSSTRLQPVVLRATDEEAVALAFASGNGALWLALRPTAGAKQMSRPSAQTLSNMLFGVAPISERELRRQLGTGR